jgi:hypothetical protein
MHGIGFERFLVEFGRRVYSKIPEQSLVWKIAFWIGAAAVIVCLFGFILFLVLSGVRLPL